MMTIRAVSLPQPNATLVALGLQTVLPLRFKTDYRGRVALHAIWTETAAQVEACQKFPVGYYLNRAGYLHAEQMAKDAILATARLVGCRPVPLHEAYRWPQCAISRWLPGWYAWHFEDVEPTPYFMHVSRGVGLWSLEVPEGMEALACC